MSDRAFEINFDGLVGPTHNYGGLSFGNIASDRNRRQRSNPRDAALQGLDTMEKMMAMGLHQAVLPPHQRPSLQTLRRLGFTGSDAEVLDRAMSHSPDLFMSCCSASSMWTANAATVTPSADAADRRVHFTPANLCTTFHRSIEGEESKRILRAIFADRDHFQVHDPLPSHPMFGDEGAANHNRLCVGHGDPGLEVFVYGAEVSRPGGEHRGRFPARQTREACEAVARLHQLDPERTMMVRQQAEAIDAGVFHNDVICVANQNVLLLHHRAFVDQPRVLEQMRRRFDGELRIIQVSESLVTLPEAVETYLFNSKLVTLPDGRMALVVPVECRESPSVWAFLQQLLADDNPVNHVEVVDLHQSMRNGGGPACLRLRVVLTEAEMAAMGGAVLLDADRLGQLRDWVRKHFRDRLEPEDLADPQLVTEARDALDELTQVLKLGSIYGFQTDGDQT